MHRLYIGRELTAHWDSEGGRHVANDLVVPTCRQVKALRSVTAGLTRSGGSVPEPRAGSSRARGDTRVPEPPAPPRRREAEGSPPKRACKEEHSAEDDGEESEEEERRVEHSPPRDADHKPIRDHRPRSPPGPPPSERDYPGAKSIGLSRQGERPLPLEEDKGTQPSTRGSRFSSLWQKARRQETQEIASSGNQPRSSSAPGAGTLLLGA